jgi:hypothetical protein
MKGMMMRKLGIAAVAVIALVVTASALAAGTKKPTYSYKATMTAGQEVPKPKAPAKAGGIFTATVTENGAKRSIVWKLTFHNLSGPAVAAHIHMGKPGTAGGVLLALCGPCKSGMTGHAAISTDVGDALEQGKTYVNVHTAKNAAGEIRGAAKLGAHT